MPRTPRMHDRPCPLCGSTDASQIFADANFNLEKLDDFGFASRKLPEYMHYRLINCPTCDLLYASPVPDDDFLHQSYHEASFDSQEEARCAARTYGSFLPRICANIPTKVGALDIGTGDGVFLKELMASGFTEVMGVEPSVAPIEAADADIKPLIKHDIFRPEAFAPSSLSLVTCFQTLEHLTDPLLMAKSAYQVLKPGGAVFFIGHNRRAMSAKILGRKSPIFDIEHLQLFSNKSGGELLKRAGFEKIEVLRVYNRYPLHYWCKLFPIPSGMKQGVINGSKKIGVGKIPIKIPAGNIAMIGYKPR